MGDRIKVLHLITRLAVGGAQDNTLLTVEKHDRQQFEVHLASNPVGVWCDRAVRVADVFHALPDLVNPIAVAKDWQCLGEIVRLLRRERFDIVHTHSSKAGFLGRLAAKIAQVPIVVHTIHGFPFNDLMSAWKRQLFINLEKWAAKGTDFSITVSDLNRQEAIALGILHSSNSKTIYSGIDFVQLDRDSDPLQTRHNLQIPDRGQIVLMVGRLDNQKAPHFLIDAFAQVVQQCPETSLLLVGDGELKPKLQAQVQQLGIEPLVKFLGSRDDVPEILQIADVFALSSLWEGLGRAMTEAMLVGKPVVVPNIYGIPEIVKHNDTGLLFEAGAVDRLGKHLVYLLQNPQERQRLGQNARNLTRKLFSGDRMVQQIEQVYGELLARSELKSSVVVNSRVQSS